jgi:serine/threonine-protein kinase TTK/MPS1
MQPYLRTPITKLCTVPDQHKVESELKPAVQLRPSLDPTFQRIKVNDVEYIILNELGKGGSSEVFHCYNHEMKTHRAIKVVSLANGASATGFINEVKMLKALQQCNRIIKMFD